MSLPPRGWEISKEIQPTEEGVTVGPDYSTIGASSGPGLHDHCHPLRRQQITLNADDATAFLELPEGIDAEKDVPHVWHVDGHDHDTTEWRNNLYYFA
jgi:hypothetical protein